MAELVATALFAAETYSGVAAFAELAVAVTEYAVVFNAAATFVATSAYGMHQKRKAAAAARDAYNAALQDRLVMTTTAQTVRSRCYGRVRNVDGIIWKGAHGADSEYYTLVIALAGHRVDAIEEIWFNDVPVSLDGSGYVTTEPWSGEAPISATTTVTVTGGAGSVTLPHDSIGGSVHATIVAAGAGPDGGDQTQEATLTASGTSVTITSAPVDGTYTVYYQYSAGQQLVQVRKYLGTTSQNLYSDLVGIVGGGSDLESTDRFAGIAALIVTMKYSQNAFPTGVPQISAVIRGALVNDPRTGTTAWSQNPALIARDWVLYSHGGGLTESDLVDDSFEAAANACDVSTAFPAASGTQTRPLYQAGIAIRLEGNPDEDLDEIVEAMAGKWTWSGGRLAVRAGVYRAPVASITEDWVTSVTDVSVLPQTATADLVNVMRPTIADADRGYVAAPVAEVRSTAFLALDGDVEWARELTLGAVTRPVHAQHVCGVLMREARDGLTCKLPCNLRAFALEVFDVVDVTLPIFGWSAKLFEVIGTEFSATGGVLLTLRELAAANYTVDTALDELTSAENTGLPDPSSVPQMSLTSVTSGTTTLADGSLVSRVALAWNAVASEAVRQSGSIEVQYVKAMGTVADGAWVTAAPAPGYATGTTLYGLQRGVHYLLRVRARNTLGVTGKWSTQAIHQVSARRRMIVWRQATAPSVAQSQDGDIWIDSAKRQHLFESGAWIDVRDTAIADAQDAADAAAAAATSALGDAAAAMGRIDDMYADGVLTPVEKPRAIQDYAVILAEQSGIDAQATNYAVTTEKTAYDTAVSALTTYLGTLTSAVAWNNLSGNTTIAGTTWRTKWGDVYTKRQAVLDKISANAKARLGDLATLDTVDTPQIEDNAATNPANAFTAAAGGTTSSGAVLTEFTLQTYTGTFTGAPVTIRGAVDVFVFGSGTAIFKVKEDSTVLYQSDDVAPSINDTNHWSSPDLQRTPSAGSHTYTFTLSVDLSNPPFPAFNIINYSNRSLAVVEFKK